jgi:hypothetical protein
MMMIYLDSSALGIPRSGPDGGGFHVQRDLARMVGHLVDAGHDVVLTGEARPLDEICAALPAPVTARIEMREGPAMDLDAEAAGWVVTSDAAVCEQLRDHRRLRTILVGSAGGASDQLDRPADVVARSLTDAVLEILTEDAMTPGNGDRRPA